MEKKLIYADHNATSPVRPEVVALMQELNSSVYGNASSMHLFGQKAKKCLEDSREMIAKLLNAERPEEIVFTSCGTEADNFAVKGIAWSNSRKGKHIITSSLEHPAVLNACDFLSKNGFDITYLPVNGFGLVDPEDVQKAFRNETILVSVMHANNETGTIEPIKQIGGVIREENENRYRKQLPRIYFHTDAVQSCGKINVDVQELGVDLLSLSGHKFYGPKGVGALFIRKGTYIEPVQHGGHHERNLRAGTENIAGIAGMVKALELDLGEMSAEQVRLSGLRDMLEKGIKDSIPEIEINGHHVERLANTLNVSFRHIEGESILLSLDLEGIAVSTGSACASGSSEPSHVLKAMGCDPEAAQGAVRFSLGRQNSEEDIRRILEVLPKTIDRLRSMSPVWAGGVSNKK